MAMITFPSFTYKKAPMPQSYIIQGKSASLYEYNVALALEKLGIDYIFQFSIMGGKMHRGYVIDFIINTPIPIPLEVNGEYWHRNMALELRQKSDIDAYLSQFGYAPLAILWGKDTDTEEHALSSARRIVYG